MKIIIPPQDNIKNYFPSSFNVKSFIEGVLPNIMDNGNKTVAYVNITTIHIFDNEPLAIITQKVNKNSHNLLIEK